MTRFEHAYVLNVLSNDHPVIVAAVGNAVESLGGNIDACSQTVLSGYFTLIMIVSFPKAVGREALVAQVRASQSADSQFQVLARPIEGSSTGTSAAAGPVERFIVTAFGKDKPGVVKRFSEYLAGKDINIVDLYGDRSGSDFVLISQVEVPSRWEISALQADLEDLGQEMGFNVRLQHENIFVATNQLRLTVGHRTR